MFTVQWLCSGIIHHSFLPNSIITTDVYGEDQDTMMKKLLYLQPALLNRLSTLLLYDNAQPHMAQSTVFKLQEVWMEVFASTIHTSCCANRLTIILFSKFEQLLGRVKMQYPKGLTENNWASKRSTFKDIEKWAKKYQ